MQKIFQKFLVASVMLAGLFVASCHPKPIPKEKDPVNAVAEIIVSALDAESGKDVSTDPALKISASSSANSPVSVNGNVIKIEGSPEISQQTVTINAEFNGKKASTTVQVNALSSGGQAVYPANVIFEATQPQKEAKAIVIVNVWDNESDSDVTAQSIFTPLGVPDSYSCKEGDTKGTFVITGVGGISAFQFTVNATYGNAIGVSDVINIDNIAEGTEKTYLVYITLGTPHVDEDKPAVAVITVTAFDKALDADVTESTEISATLEDDSEASVKVEDNIVTITAGESLDIAAQDVTICAKYGDESIERVVSLSEIKKNSTAAYSCEIVFEATQPQKEAKAIVAVSVWDYESDSDVTAQSTFTPLGVPDSYSCKESDTKGTFVITGVGGISAFQFAVKATYGNAVGEAKVDIDAIAEGAEKAYLVSITLGTPHVDEDKPAVAVITVTAFDKALDADVTESTEIFAALEDDPEASVKVEDNIVTITAGESLEIAAQDVTIYAKYGNESIEKVVTLSKIEKNKTAAFTCEVVFNEKGEEEITYSLRHEKTVAGSTKLYQLTQGHSELHKHDYSHNGLNITNWLYNETEFIFVAEFKWTKVYGVSNVAKTYAAGCTDEDKAKIDAYAKTFGLTYTEKEQTLSHAVSAYARYTAYSTRTPYYATYDVVRTKGAEETVVGTIKVTSWASDAQYVETSIPGHEGHYVPGHGHDDHGHGHGGSNAGGGIIGSE